MRAPRTPARRGNAEDVHEIYRDTAVNLPAFLVVVGMPTALALLLLIPVGRRLPPAWFRPVAVVVMLLPAPTVLGSP